MYKIITNTGETHLTEKPNFIRKHENGCFVLTDEVSAEGVAYNGKPYLFSDGSVCCEVDTFDVISKEDTENREAVEQSITDLYLDGIQAQQDITDIQLQLLGG